MTYLKRPPSPGPDRREIRRRWARFHAAISRANASGAPALIFRLFPPNSRRFNLLRAVSAPLVHRRSGAGTIPARRTSSSSSSSPELPGFNPEAIRRVSRSPAPPMPAHVLVLDDTALSTAQIVAQLDSTPCTWVHLSAGPSDAPEVAHAVHRLAGVTTEADVLYADELLVDDDQPILRPDVVGPHSLLSFDVVGWPLLLRVSALRALELGRLPEGPLAPGRELVLALEESGALVEHLDEVLASPRRRRSLAVDDAQLAAVRRSIDRRGWRASVSADAHPEVIQWRPELPSPAPSVTILVPTRDRLELLEACLESVTRLTRYPSYSILVIDNDSAEPATLEYLASCGHEVLSCPGPFNYSSIINRGVRHATTELVVTLNNDTIVHDSDWLEQLVALASLDGVGIVGARMIEPDGRVEHDGIVIAPYPQHLRSDSNYLFDDAYAHGVRDLAAVTGACQVISRALYEELGGMDEKLAVVLNDVDLCLRTLEGGRLVVFTPHVALTHRASSSRGALNPYQDTEVFIRRWDIFGTFVDPFFPASLSMLGEHLVYRATR